MISRINIESDAVCAKRFRFFIEALEDKHYVHLFGPLSHAIKGLIRIDKDGRLRLVKTNGTKRPLTCTRWKRTPIKL